MTYECTLCGDRAFLSVGELRAHLKVAHRPLKTDGPEERTPRARTLPRQEETHVTRDRSLTVEQEELTSDDVLERIEALHRAGYLTMSNIRRCFDDAAATSTAGIEELAALFARTEQAAVITGGRRIDYLELAGLSLGFWLRRSQSRSKLVDPSRGRSPAAPPESPRDAATAILRAENEGAGS